MYWSRSDRKIWCLDCGRPGEGADSPPGKRTVRAAPSQVHTAQRKPQVHGPGQERWEQLCGYLRDCVRVETADTLADFRFRDKEWFLHSGGSEALVTGEADSIPIPDELARLSSRLQPPDTPLTVIYGWPTLVALDAKNHLKVAPLFVLPVEVNVQRGELLADSEPEFNVGVTAGQLFDPSVYEEIKYIVGDGVPFGDRPSLMVLASRISDALSVAVHSELDPDKLVSRLGGNLGMYNAAISIVVSDGRIYAASLLKELDSLAKRTDWVDTAAAWLVGISDPRASGGRSPTEPLAAPLPTNHSQETILDRLRTESLTVIKGPPGTGKTQLVANAVGNAWLDRDKILVTSTNNAAVDVAVDRSNRDICTGVLFRTGNRTAREDLRAIVAEAVAEVGLSVAPAGSARARLARAHKQRSGLLETLERQTRIRETLLGKVEQLEKDALDIWEQPRAPELPISPQRLADRADSLQRAWYFRRRRTRRLLRAIASSDPGVALDKVKSWVALSKVKSWATGETQRQQLIRELDTIDANVGCSDAAVGTADTEWIEASREAVRAVAASRLGPRVANALAGGGQPVQTVQAGHPRHDETRFGLGMYRHVHGPELRSETGLVRSHHR